MGVDTRRPPLPLPTESWADNNSVAAQTDLATDVSRRTDRTSYSIPEDGSPITISTKKYQRHQASGSNHSQASLLIEYFEDKPHSSKPSIRVKVTESSKKRRNGDALKITKIGADSKPAYTQRIPLGNRSEPQASGGTEVSLSSGNLSNPPIEIEVINNSSDLSSLNKPRSRAAPMASDISSMPADSLLEGPVGFRSPEKRSGHALRNERFGDPATDNLKPPQKDRSRSLSRERIAHKVIEKLTSDRHQESSDRRKARQAPSRSKGKDMFDEDMKPRSHRSSKQYPDSDIRSGTESSLRARDYDSNISGASRSSVTNPKVIQAVEDAIRRLILPEIESIKRQQSLRYDRGTRDSYTSESTNSRADSDRRLSKSSTSRPRDVLRKDESDTGVTTKEKRNRRTSRDSPEKSRDIRERRPRETSRSSRGSGLTASALGDHDRRESRERRRKERRESRSSSQAALEDNGKKRASVPPMPLTSEMLDSELTRESILSAETAESERPCSDLSQEIKMPVRSVSRSLPQAILLPDSPRPPNTPTSVPLPPSRTSDRQGVTSERAQTPLRDLRSPTPASVKSARSSDKSIRTRAKNAGLAAAGLGGAATGALYPRDKPRDSTSRSPEVARNINHSRELVSAPSTPGAEYSTAQKRHQGINLGDNRELVDSPMSPQAGEYQRDEEMNAFYDQQHRLNNRYRNSAEYESQRESGVFSDLRSAGSLDRQNSEANTDQEVKDMRPAFGRMESPVQVESNVASLVDPSNLDSEQSNQVTNPRFSYESVSSTDEAHLSSRDGQANRQQHGLTEHDNPSRDRWTLLKQNAIALSSDSRERLAAVSPSRTVSQSAVQAQSRAIYEKDLAPAKAEPSSASTQRYQNAPMPLVGQTVRGNPQATYPQQRDSFTSSLTNLSDEAYANVPIEGGLLGYAKINGEGWPRELDGGATADREVRGSNSRSAADPASSNPRGFVPGEASFETVPKPPVHDRNVSARSMEPLLEDDYMQQNVREQQIFDAQSEHYSRDDNGPRTPTHLQDESYPARSPNATPLSYTKTPQRLFEEVELPKQRALERNPNAFTPVKQPRLQQLKTPDAPMYDSATGKGLNEIQSQDVVALMDHLTVRDGHRNARDTEILVTLVRSAAEMRTAFEEMKQFMEDQNRINMEHTGLDTDRAVNRILSNQARSTPARTQLRASATDNEDPSAKKQNIFKRALKGLGSRNQGELARMEDMLNQLLDQMDEMRDAHTSGGQQFVGHQDDGLNSSERLRSVQVPGYGTSSTPTWPADVAASPQARQGPRMYSGYDLQGPGKKRVSTVMEDDERSEEHEDGMRTPTQDDYRSPKLGSAQREVGFQGVDTSADDKSRKHKSNGSSLWGIPRMSRWSKTTTSSGPDNNRSSGEASGQPRDLAFSDGSRSGSDINVLPGTNAQYTATAEDKFRSVNSLPRDQALRSPSPLAQESSPSPFDDPKYRAHRHSLTLEHPQPRTGSTRRHQNKLEDEAYSFDDLPIPSPDSDAFGSAPSLARFNGGVLGAVQPRAAAHSYLAPDTTTSAPAPPKTAGDSILLPRNAHAYEPMSLPQQIQPHQATLLPQIPHAAPSILYTTPLNFSSPEPVGNLALPPTLNLPQNTTALPPVPTWQRPSSLSSAGSASPDHTRHPQATEASPRQPRDGNTLHAPDTPRDESGFEDEDDDDPSLPLSRKRSPYRPGALLAPIEERYSMELDRSSLGYRSSVKSTASGVVGFRPQGQGQGQGQAQTQANHAHRFSITSLGSDVMADVREETEGELAAERAHAATPENVVPRPAVGARGDDGVRKLTGPREMPGMRRTSSGAASGAASGMVEGAAVPGYSGGAATGLQGTVRRKPARKSQ